MGEFVEEHLHAVNAGRRLSPGRLELVDVLGQSPRPCDATGSGDDQDRGKKEAEDPRLHVIPDRIPKGSKIRRVSGRICETYGVVRAPAATFGCRIT